MGRYDKYQPNVGRAQGGNVLFITSGGFFDVGDQDGGASGQQISGLQLMRILTSPVTRTSVTLASAIQTVSVLPASVGLVNIYYPSATTSVTLPPANAGATLIINFPAAALSTLSMKAGTSASIAVGYSDCSMILASVNALSGVWVQLNCYTDNEWQVAELSGTAITPQRSS